MIDEQFEIVVSSHCIEHQPDIVRHIQAVEKLLIDGGCYALRIPDRRYCHDHYLPDSTLAAVLDAYYAERKVHSLKSVIEAKALVTHNNAWRHWFGSHGPRRRDIAHATRLAVDVNRQGYLCRRSRLAVHAVVVRDTNLVSQPPRLYRDETGPGLCDAFGAPRILHVVGKAAMKRAVLLRRSMPSSIFSPQPRRHVIRVPSRANIAAAATATRPSAIHW